MNDETTQAPQDSPKKEAPNYAFYTPTEAGLRSSNTDDIPAAPRPQPGMTFTPTGGSVSDIAHKLNDDNQADNQLPQNQ